MEDPAGRSFTAEVPGRAPSDRGEPGGRPGAEQDREDGRAEPEGGRSYHHGNLPQALREEILRQVQAGGVSSLSLRRAARSAGVSTSAPYRHYGGRSELLAQMAREGFDALAEALRSARAGASAMNPLETLRLLGEAYIRFALANPALFRIMYTPELSDRSPWPQLSEAYRRAFAVLVEVVAELQEAGVLPPGDPQAQAIAPWSMVHGYSVLALDGQLQGTPAAGDLGGFGASLLRMEPPPPPSS